MNKSKKVMKIRRKDHLDLMIWTQEQVTKMETSDTPLFFLLPQRNFFPRR
jgi:hypothetical protein